MKWPLVAYRFGLVIFLIIILLIAAIAVMPVLKGDISVERGEEGMDWTLENETFTGSATVWINNSGYLDFENMVFDIHVEALHSLYLNSTQRVGEINAGEDKKVVLTFSRKISEISEETKTHLLRHDTEVNMTVDMDGQYSYSLFTFTAEKEDVLQWGAPFHDLRLSGPYYSNSPPEIEMDISFDNHYRRVLNFDIIVEVFDDQGDTIGSTTESHAVPVGESFDETIAVGLSGDPDHVLLRFKEENSGMVYEKEVVVG